MSRKITSFLAALAVGGLVFAGAAPANASIVERYTLDFSDSGVSDNFCDVGLHPTYTYEQTGSGIVRLRGKDGPLWFHEKLSSVTTFTYEGMTVTDTQANTVIKDQKIVETDENTLEITVLFAGGGRLVGSDGKLLAKNDGQIRLLVTIDLATEEVISEEVVFGSTGTNSSFCDAILAHWGVEP
ncbi:hypothetical protein [Microbacterium sp. HJ5]